MKKSLIPLSALLLVFALQSASSAGETAVHATLTVFQNVAPNYTPTQLRCFCPDGTVYSYGNNCKVGASGCDSNPCPPQPSECGGS